MIISFHFSYIFFINHHDHQKKRSQTLDMEGWVANELHKWVFQRETIANFSNDDKCKYKHGCKKDENANTNTEPYITKRNTNKSFKGKPKPAFQPLAKKRARKKTNKNTNKQIQIQISLLNTITNTNAGWNCLVTGAGPTLEQCDKLARQAKPYPAWP